MNKELFDAIANDNSLTPERLTELSMDRHAVIRSGVAANKNTPVDVLTELSKDSDSDVRSYAEKNPKSPTSNYTFSPLDIVEGIELVKFSVGVLRLINPVNLL